MSALIIDLAEARARKQHTNRDGTFPSQLPAADDSKPSGKERFQFWTGASGTRYVHTVYDLVSCPTLPAANYMLITRSDDGELDVLSIGHVNNQAAPLNLAEVRRHGAELGAKEVHVHLLADDARNAQLIQQDLQTGHLAATWHGQHSALAH